MPSEKIRYLRHYKDPVVDHDEVLTYLSTKPSTQLAQLLLYRSGHDVILRKLIFTEASLTTQPASFNTWKKIVEFALDLPLEPIDTELESAGADQILELLIHNLEIFKADLTPKEFQQWTNYLYDCADTLTESFHDGFMWAEALKGLEKLKTNL